MTTLNKLLDERQKAVVAMRSLLDRAEGEKRDLTAEEQVTYDKHFNDVDRLKNRIGREQKQQELDREIAATLLKTPDTKTGKPLPEAPESPELKLYTDFLRGRMTPQVQNALQTDGDTQGGYLVIPQQMVQTILKNVDNMTFIRTLCQTFPVSNADSLGQVSLDNDPDDFDWTVELATGNEDSTMSFGKRELRPHPLAKKIKISKTLMRKAPEIESFVNQRLAYKLAVTQEKAFLTGTGNQQPLGVFTASNNGIPTSRDISTDNTTSGVTFDGLINAFYSLKMQYQGVASWLFHRDAVKQISKLKDGDGQYLWQSAVRAGDPDTIKGRAVYQSEYVPNTFTSGQYVGIIGDFKQYYIADGMQPSLQRLTELYAETNQEGFIIRYEGDGMPVLSEAFTRIKLA